MDKKCGQVKRESGGLNSAGALLYQALFNAGVRSICSDIAPDNIASQTVTKKLGGTLFNEENYSWQTTANDFYNAMRAAATFDLNTISDDNKCNRAALLKTVANAILNAKEAANAQ